MTTTDTLPAERGGGVSADELYALLTSRYSRNDGWELIPQVPDGTGMAKGRTADAVAFQTWPSKGLEWHGFEIKIHRGDWLRELANLQKSAPFVEFLDRWWIVAPVDVLTVEELPSKWGWLCPRGGKLVQKSPAVPLEPGPPDRYFLAGVMRRFAKATGHEERVRAQVSAARQQGREAGAKEEREMVQHELAMAEKRLEAVRAFEEEAGFRLDAKWGRTDAAKVAAAARAIVSGEYDLAGRKKAMRRTRAELLRSARALRKAERGLDLE